MTPPLITIEFFHDVMSCWCFPVSEKLRSLVAENANINVIHHSFVLAATPDMLGRLFTNKDEAKREIVMEHWNATRRVEQEPRINCELMMSRDFDYPWSIPAQLACKATEKQAGQAGHWDMFDRLQRAHLTECQNIADETVLENCAIELGLEVGQWRTDCADPATRAAIDADMGLANRYGVMRIPGLIANGRFQVHGMPYTVFGWHITAEKIDEWIADLVRYGEMNRGLNDFGSLRFN
ncbi:MAG: DsbA family protein [Gammaproteobacteria bacterium]|nr:MAG: DsbA family protein [Gammaproteobacteria bacterium]